MARIGAACYGCGGAIGLFASFVMSDHRPLGAIRALSACAVLLGAGVALVGVRLPRWAAFALTQAAVPLIAAAIWVQRARPEGAAGAPLLLLVSLFTFTFFDRAAWLVSSVLVVGTLLVARLDWHALPWVTVVMQAGLNLLVGVVVGWLVRAAAAAETDPLTGLVNARGFQRALTAALERPDGQPVTVAFLDLDGFTALNQQRGRAGGERLLATLGRTWAACAADTGAVISRPGGDEFAVILRHGDATAMATLLQRLRAAAPEGARFSAGVTVSTPADTALLVAGRADAALHRAKRDGAGQTVFDEDVSCGDVYALTEGLAAGEFSVAYQPVVDPRTYRLTGAEALLRWARPGRGPVPPDQFIPVAERSGFILTLGGWVLDQACREAASWPAEAAARIAVNVSGAELNQPDYCGQVQRTLLAAGLPADRLVLEVTESTFEAESPLALETLRQLRKTGVKIAIDDFGTGYSSLSRVQQLPADILKIDRSFLSPARSAAQPAPIVAAVTALAHTLGLQVVAEGVETGQHAELLAQYGCDEGQGWYFGRPAGPQALRAQFALQPLPER
jgi:diguanylate cyclase (GGDEF)-like protein